MIIIKHGIVIGIRAGCLTKLDIRILRGKLFRRLSVSVTGCKDQIAVFPAELAEYRFCILVGNTCLFDELNLGTVFRLDLSFGFYKAEIVIGGESPIVVTE